LIQPEELEPFRPRVNWRFWAPILSILLLFPVVWGLYRYREARGRRAQLLREHALLTGELAPAYRARRALVERLVLESVGPYAGDLRAPGFGYPRLTREPVLYARTRLGEVRDLGGVARSIRHRYPDQLLGCLGTEALPAREFFDKGEFLLPEFVDAVREAGSVSRLAALRSDLRFRLRRDTPLLADGLRRPLLVLVVDEAPVSIDGPSRVYVYDLSEGRPLLRVRGGAGDVALVPVRIHGLPAPPPTPSTAPRPTVSLHDCGVAGAVRRALGVDSTPLHHLPPEPAPVDADAGAGASDGSATARTDGSAAHGPSP
jgi:hypothetical protein